MNPCPEHREAIVLAAANALDTEGVAALGRHLDTCPRCQEALDEMRQLCGRLSQAPREQADACLPNRFHQRLAARVREDARKQSQNPLPARLWAWLTLPRLSLATGLTVVLIAVLLWSKRSRVEPGPAGSPTATRIRVTLPAAPTLLALSRALNESTDTLDALLAQQERLLAANDPPSFAFGAGARVSPPAAAPAASRATN